MDYPDKVKQAYDKVRDKTGSLSLEAFAGTKVPGPSHHDRWGNWELDTANMLLIYVEERRRHGYEIDLKDMTDSAHMLDWIFQLNMKTWVSRKDMGDLIQALDDLFRPQSTLCGQGKDKHLDTAAYLRKRLGSPR